jgi:RNA polymerase sigma factor (TIGR02999 family)
MISRQPTVTELIGHWRRGDRAAGASVLASVYPQLRALAGRALHGERAGHTLQPTALVHEAWLRMTGERLPAIVDRGHFLAIAVRLMRQILVNHARDRRAAKRGGEAGNARLDAALALYEERCGDLVALDDALARLADLDARRARLVELRFFGGMTMSEAATVLGMPIRTAEREWSAARAWLAQEMTTDAA